MCGPETEYIQFQSDFSPHIVYIYYMHNTIDAENYIPLLI